jgi:hypothetical protein
LQLGLIRRFSATRGGFEDSKLNENQKKALLLWLNGALSILLYFGRRAITEGAWMQMKKPAWASMPVLDVTALDASALSKFATAYDQLADKELHPIALLDKDPVRCQIDDTICGVLGLPSLDLVRQLLAREPGLTAHDIAPREKASEDEDNGENEDQPELEPIIISAKPKKTAKKK